MAGWLKKLRFAARVTWRSSNSAWSGVNRFRSRFRKCTSRMIGILTMHGPNYKHNVSYEEQRAEFPRATWPALKGEIPDDKYINEERDYHRCIWWNRKLDRK